MSISAGARALIAAVVLLTDLAILWVFSSGPTPSSAVDASAVLVVKVNALVGAMICLVLVVLNLRSRGGQTSPAAPSRWFSVLGLVALLKLLAVAAALLVFGAFTTLNGVQLAWVSIAESLAVVWLAVGTARHLAGARPSARRR